MSRYDVDVIVDSAKEKRTINVLLGEAKHLNVIGEVQGLPHSGLWDSVFPTEMIC